jgi:protein-tyrosine-phosphatase
MSIFTNEKWQEVLSSHGIIIDADKKTLTIQSTKAQQDFVYDLTDEEVKKLTQNNLKGDTVKDRLDVINHVIGGDFQEPVTRAMLDSKDRISIALKPEVEQELRQKMQADAMQQTVIQDPLKEQHYAPSSIQ